MEVEVPDADNTPASNNLTEFFAKQIAIEPDYILSVSPTSVREDDDPTNIAVKVRVCDTCDEVGCKYACVLAAL